MTEKQKKEDLKSLSKKRKEENLTDKVFRFNSKSHQGYAMDVSEFGQDLDTDQYVTPYTKGSHNLNSNIMLVLHDWSSKDDLDSLAVRLEERKQVVKIGRDKDKKTNKALEFYLRFFLNKNISDIYTTNAFPFVKPGSMKGGVSAGKFRYCAEKYTVKEIEIIKPKIVLAATEAFNALHHCYCDSGDVIPDCFEHNGHTIMRIYHPSAPQKKKKIEQWEKVRIVYNKLCSS